MKQNRKPTFFTSDWHIGHKKCLEFDNRPFDTIEDMHKGLIKRYNANVPEDGICYHLGDVGMASVDLVKSVITKLNGTKVLILGNHDGNVNRMYNCGFDVVLYSADIYIAGQRVSMSHCPLPGIFRENMEGMRNVENSLNWHGEYRHLKFQVKDNGQFHLHGHIHSTPDNNKITRTNRQWDVSVCGNNYMPVSMSQIESWISKELLNEN